MKKKPSAKKIGVILMTYGSPSTLNEVPSFLKNVYGGREPTAQNVAEFVRRYKLIGMSPLVAITQAQATALKKKLNADHAAGSTFTVAAGMRFSPPYISDAVAELAKSVDHIIGIIMSPQYSPIIMSGYHKVLTEAGARAGKTGLTISMIEDWHLQPHFIKAIAERVTQALAKFPVQMRKTIPVLFSAHSMPRRVIEHEPDYISHLRETASAVAEAVGLSPGEWMFCYQSAGHTPEEWLKPDFADIMPELHATGQTHVLIAPIQFLADHLEILYDVEIGARQQAEEHHLTFARTESLNTSPLFIQALAEVVHQCIEQQIA